MSAASFCIVRLDLIVLPLLCVMFQLHVHAWALDECLSPANFLSNTIIGVSLFHSNSILQLHMIIMRYSQKTWQRIKFGGLAIFSEPPNSIPQKVFAICRHLWNNVDKVPKLNFTINSVLEAKPSNFLDCHYFQLYGMHILNIGIVCMIDVM